MNLIGFPVLIWPDWKGPPPQAPHRSLRAVKMTWLLRVCSVNSRYISCLLTNHGIGGKEDFVGSAKGFDVASSPMSFRRLRDATSRIDQDIVIVVAACLAWRTISTAGLLAKWGRDIDLLTRVQRWSMAAGINIGFAIIKGRLFLDYFVGLISQQKKLFYQPMKIDHHDNGWNLWRFDNFCCFWTSKSLSILHRQSSRFVGRGSRFRWLHDLQLARPDPFDKSLFTNRKGNVGL